MACSTVIEKLELRFTCTIEYNHFSCSRQVVLGEFNLFIIKLVSVVSSVIVSSAVVISTSAVVVSSTVVVSATVVVSSAETTKVALGSAPVSALGSALVTAIVISAVVSSAVVSSVIVVSPVVVSTSVAVVSSVIVSSLMLSLVASQQSTHHSTKATVALLVLVPLVLVVVSLERILKLVGANCTHQSSANFSKRRVFLAADFSAAVTTSNSTNHRR